MKATDLRATAVSELETELAGLMKERFALSMQKATGQLKKPHLLTHLRRDIARIKTVLAEKKVKAHD